MSQKTFHQRNLNLVLQQVINHPLISRIDIAHRLNMNKSSITNLFNELKGKNLLIEVGSGNSTKNGGRRPTLLRINKDYGFVITFQLFFKHLYMMANSLNGQIINYKEIKTGLDIKEILTLIDEQINNMIKIIKIPFLGICFSINGIVYHNKILKSPFLDMKNVDLFKRYSQKYKVPVVLENEANLIAIYKRDFSKNKTLKNIICISIHRGIGSGIIVNHQLYHGKKGFSGQIGQLIRFVPPKEKTNPQLDNMENNFSEEAILDHIKTQKKLKNLNLKKVVKLFKQNDPVVIKELNNFTNIMTNIIFDVNKTFAPDKFFLDSTLMRSLPKAYRKIKTSLNAMDKNINISLINSNKTALLGGYSLIFHHILKLDAFKLRFSKPKTSFISHK